MDMLDKINGSNQKWGVSNKKMKFVFSKKKFMKNAPAGIKRQLGNHIDVLDGQEVEFDERWGKDGVIKQYFKDGKEYYLFPVYKSWCETVEINNELQNSSETQHSETNCCNMEHIKQRFERVM